MSLKNTLNLTSIEAPDFASDKIRPCAICGLAPKIRIDKNLGRVCLYFNIRIPSEETQDPNTQLRRYCIQQGNYFIWPAVNVTPVELLELTMARRDWRLKRLGLKIAAVTALLVL